MKHLLREPLHEELASIKMCAWMKSRISAWHAMRSGRCLARSIAIQSEAVVRFPFVLL